MTACACDCSENNHTENTILKSWAGFKGWVCSDYDGTRSTIDAANGGLDIAMPGPPNRPDFFGSMLIKEVAAGTVTEATVTEKATRVVYSLAKVGALDTPRPPTAGADVTSAAHLALARKLASSACILLKNEGGILPLTMSTKVAVIGDAGNLGAIYGGAGSGSVVPKNSSAVPLFVAMKARGIEAVHATGHDVAHAQAVAKAADVVIVVLAQSSTEGHDRQWLNLTQAELVPAVASANKKTVVLTVTPGPFLTAPWIEHAAALVDIGLPGEQEGNGAIDVLFGLINPSGKLPHTLPNKFNEVEMTAEQYPGSPPDGKEGPPCTFAPISQDPGGIPSPKFVSCSPTKAHYTEKLEVGYRWYDAHDVKPAFAFGFGLSYTTFAYSGLQVSGREVSFYLKNTGEVTGAEVSQLYLTYPSVAQQPFKQLRGFNKTVLAPGAQTMVSFTLTDRWLSNWDAVAHAWKLTKGTFAVGVGGSSDDLPLTGEVHVA